MCVRNIDNEFYYVDYVSLEQFKNDAPKFNLKTHKINLKIEIRDSKIEELLNSIKIEVSDFDVEDIIYTEEQRDRLNRLRNKKPIIHRWDFLKKVRKEYSESFNIGDKVWYENKAGFITFKHADKSEDQITRWSVKVNDTEFRYVSGTELLTRVVRDLSYIKIDTELDKLSTETLLKKYRSGMKRSKGSGNLAIKRILQEREHVQCGDNKIVIVNK